MRTTDIKPIRQDLSLKSLIRPHTEEGPGFKNVKNKHLGMSPF